MSASCTIQAAHPSSTWTTYRRPLLHHIPAPACCFGYIFLHRHFLQPLFRICGIQLLPQGYGGSLAHSLLSELLYLEQVPSQPSLTWSHCVSFRLPYSPACDYFSPSSIFSPRTFFWIFHTFTPRWRQRRKSSTPTTCRSLPLLECTLLVILYWRGRCNFHVLFSRDWKSLFIKWNLL